MVKDLGSIEELAQDWYREMRGRNLAHSTVNQYRKAVDNLTDWLKANDRSLSPEDITRKVLTRYFSELADSPKKRNPGQTVSASWVSFNYRGLQQFFRWLADVEEEITENPFLKMSVPKIPEKPVPILADEDISALLDAAKGAGFRERRDTAVIRLLIDTGLRVSELSGIMLDDVNFRVCTVTVLGKGRKLRTISFSDSTATALRRYLRSRQSHTRADLPNLWLGKQGPMTRWGIKDLLDYRAGLAQVEHANPHRFRHTFVHLFLADGHGETDLMRITGWSSRTMVDRYASSTADVRAREAHRKAAIGDKF